MRVSESHKPMNCQTRDCSPPMVSGMKTFYEYDPAFIKEKVNVLLRIGKKDKVDSGMIEKLGFILDERRGRYYEASYYCRVSHSLSGRLFGQLSNFKD